jgi:hypothetical protein
MALRRSARVVAVAAGAAASLAIPVTGAFAAGETTHAFMADEAIDALPAGSLRSLLSAHRLEVMSGAGYPDTGYWVENGTVPVRGDELRPSDDFGEESHWERFINAYVDHIRAKDCGDLAAPLGPCAEVIAHMMGSAAHGMGDEVWDWLFEPRVTDHGEDAAKNFFAEGRPAHPLDGNPLDEASSSIEYAMDEVAITEHMRWLLPGTTAPPVNDLVEVYGRRGLTVTPEHIMAGHAVSNAAMSLERAVAPEESPRVQEDMPWSASHFVTEPGGVDFTAEAIAGYYEALWRKLTALEHPAPEVVAIHPEPGARDVPVQWLPARTAPGPATGGGELRIWAALGHAVEPSTVTPETFKLLDAAGAPVTPLAGFPRPGPWGADGGTHSILFYPAADLVPCARYTAVITTGLLDLEGASLEKEQRWTFQTAPASGRCPKPPHPPHPHGKPPK